MAKVDPRLIGLRMTDSVILATGTHRVKFTQDGRVPDLEYLKERCKVNDGRYVVSAAWMDPQRIGHATLAWKEKQDDSQPSLL
jgi:hypothetical protein